MVERVGAHLGLRGDLAGAVHGPGVVGAGLDAAVAHADALGAGGAVVAGARLAVGAAGAALMVSVTAVLLKL